MSNFTDFLGNNSDTKFVVKNIAPRGKHISIFNVGIANGMERDLLLIPGVSEDDIRVSLLKGEVLRKLKAKEITITQCDIDLLQFNTEQKAFLKASGITGGIEIGEGQLTATIQSKLSGVDDVSSLESIETTDLSDGSEVFVNTVKDHFIFASSSSLPLKDNVIIAGLNGGQWIRSIQPSTYWAFQPSFYINSSIGNDENSGIENSLPLKTHEEFARRVYPNLNYSMEAVTCFILNDVTEDILVSFSTNTVNTLTEVQYDGSLATTTLASGAIDTFTVAVPATNTEQKIFVSGMNWSLYIGKIVVMMSGASTGARFVVLKDLGSSTAQISTIQQPFVFDVLSIAPGDTFEIISLPKFGGFVSIEGHVNINFYQLELGKDDSVALVTESGNFLIDSCYLQSFDIDHNGLAYITNCYLKQVVRAFGASNMFLSGGGTAAPVIVYNESIITFSNFTIVGAGISSGEVGGKFFISLGWLAIFDSASPAIKLDNNFILLCDDEAFTWGKNCIGPRILIQPAASLFYIESSLPNIIGSGSDLSIGGDVKAYTDLPYINSKNLAKVISTTGNTGTGVGGGGGSVVTNAANGLAPAQSTTSLTSPSSTLLADPLGRANTIGPLVTSLSIAAATIGAKCHFSLLGNGNDIVITPSSGTIDGAATSTIFGSANPHQSGDLKCLVAGNWISEGYTDPAFPHYIVPVDTNFDVICTSGSGSGPLNTFIAADAASGAFSGGSWNFSVGASGDSTHHAGDFDVFIGDQLAGGDLKSGSFGIQSRPDKSSAYSDIFRMRSYFAGAEIIARGLNLQLGAGTSGQWYLQAVNYIKETCVIRTQCENQEDFGDNNETLFGTKIKTHYQSPSATPVTNKCPYTFSGPHTVDGFAMATFVDPATGHTAVRYRHILYRYDGSTTWTVIGGAADTPIADRHDSALSTCDLQFAAGTGTISLTTIGIGVPIDITIIVKWRWSLT